MVWYGITWNLEHYIQTVWRLYRQGQQAKMVLCYMLVATGTLDEQVVKVLDHKEADMKKLEDLLMKYNPDE
jgi:predicted HD phosphohydrolase